MIEQRPLPYGAGEISGISENTLAIHHDKLYAGYVKKSEEISAELMLFVKGERDLAGANQTYSVLRGLKHSESFARNGVYLHETYFESISPAAGDMSGALIDSLKERYGSVESFIAYFSACGMVARGWVVFAWDSYAKELRVFTADTHDQGGVWGAIPIIVLDVYEHAYFADYGADRKTYIDIFIKHIDWKAANIRFEYAKGISYPS